MCERWVRIQTPLLIERVLAAARKVEKRMVMRGLWWVHRESGSSRVAFRSSWSLYQTNGTCLFENRRKVGLGMQVATQLPLDPGTAL
jgi:hypothetical protein